MCTHSITTVLDDQNCLSGAGETIHVKNVLSHLEKKTGLPKGALKKVAFNKFKKLCEPKSRSETKYKDLSKAMKKKDVKKKKDPLDADKVFLLGLVKEFEEREVLLPEEEKYSQGQDTSGHVKQILGFLHSRDEFWDQI